MIKITLPDGSVREYAKGTTAMDIAKSISEGLARKVLAASVNGEVWDASRPINEDASFKLLTWDDTDGKSTFWHSTAHLMAEAVQDKFPDAKFWVGPAIDKGFYYDIDRSVPWAAHSAYRFYQSHQAYQHCRCILERR